MAVGGRGFSSGDVTVTVDESAVRAFVTGPAGPVGRLIVRVTQRATQHAKRLAPVGARSSGPGGHPSGHGRSEIGWTLTAGGDGPVGEVRSPATTSGVNPFPGEPYMADVEVGNNRHSGNPLFVHKPHLVPGLMVALADEGLL